MWPTPTRQEVEHPTATLTGSGRRQSKSADTSHSLNLIDSVRQRGAIGGSLNPTWVEWLMGWPLEWTDLQPLATDKFRQWQDSHGRR